MKKSLKLKMKKENFTILSVITLILLKPKQCLKQSTQSHPLQLRRWPITLLRERVRKQRKGGVKQPCCVTPPHRETIKELL